LLLSILLFNTEEVSAYSIDNNNTLLLNVPTDGIEALEETTLRDAEVKLMI